MCWDRFVKHQVGLDTTAIEYGTDLRVFRPEGACLVLQLARARGGSIPCAAASG